MNSDPPGVDTLEVSIFGPGKGESVAVHKPRRQKAAFGNLAINIRQQGQVGQVRARVQRGESKWNVELLPPAQELCKTGQSTGSRNR